MDLKIAGRIIAVLGLGTAMTAAVMAVRGDGTWNGMEDTPVQNHHHPGSEADRSELSRCRELGMTAAADAACRKVWAENRRRFFGSDRPERPPSPKPERFGKVGPADPMPAGDDDTPAAMPHTDRVRPNVAPGSEAAIDQEADGE
ncbi:putative entry exclusion protein TrbK-alt [Rhizobiaceae sp. 2RAB30]